MQFNLVSLMKRLLVVVAFLNQVRLLVLSDSLSFKFFIQKISEQVLNFCKDSKPFGVCKDWVKKSNSLLIPCQNC